jgi:hypothetical protein
MKRAPLLVFAVILIASGAAYAQYNPALFGVAPETDCYLACPSGDASFSFCISYNGEPLYAPAANVYMTIDCITGCIYLCSAECLDKCSYLKSNCIRNPGFGTEYSWFFRIGGCCTEARITLHMKNDPNTFYEDYIVIKTPDLDCNGVVDANDDALFQTLLGSSDPCGDFNCDGIVDMADYAIFSEHYLHSCENLIGTKDASWGAIKTIYR